MSLLLGYIPSDHDLMGAELSTDLHDIISDLFQSHPASKLGFFWRGFIEDQTLIAMMPTTIDFELLKPFSNFKLLCLKEMLSFAWSSALPGKKTCFFLGDLLQSENKATVAYHTMESLIELKQKSW
jgi:hypothetical protein